MYRKLPEYVRQSTTWSCWAASTESWLALLTFGRKPSQQELINEYATHANGGLDPTGQGRSFETLAADFGIAYRAMAGSELTMAFIEEKLRISHVLLVYNLSAGVAHANVVYGTGHVQYRWYLYGNHHRTAKRLAVGRVSECDSRRNHANTRTISKKNDKSIENHLNIQTSNRVGVAWRLTHPANPSFYRCTAAHGAASIIHTNPQNRCLVPHAHEKSNMASP